LLAALIASLAGLLTGCASGAPAPGVTAAATQATAAATADTEGATPPVFDNLGTWHRAIVTTVPAAQVYFDQGLRLVYSFNHDEAIRAFAEAERLDASCAMCAWGIALAYGPNINLPMDDQRGKLAYAAAQRALAQRASSPPADRALIEALATRYGAESRPDRAALDQTYADAMRKVAAAFPQDLDAAALFAESLLDLHPWDQWTADGTPREGTLEAVATLESVLLASPEHPGANHYYIHAVEGSQHPERALPAAGRLPGLVPGVGHMVHMPSHVYIRTGRYADAEIANETAIKVDDAYFARVPPSGQFYDIALAPHNVDFLRAAAVFEGRSAAALRAAKQAAEAMPPELVDELPDLEIMVVQPLLTAVVFGHWDDVLAVPEPPTTWLFTAAIRHFGRGIALAATGQGAAAGAELAAFEALEKAVPAERTTGFFYTTKELLQMAGGELRGEIAAHAGRLDEAISAFEDAVDRQDALRYNEPPPWYRPIRHALGKTLLAAGRAADAEAVYREDLRINPENGWSLYGLAQSLRAAGKTSEAAAIEDRFAKAWGRADVTLTASAY
jgi:tetratricopeptide (TPR) repeat protein